MRGLSGKVVLITGSSTGIGYAMAERLISEGANVFVHGYHEEEVTSAVKRLGNSARGAAGDLADPAMGQRLIDDTIAAFGTIDGLVNNAGIYPRGGFAASTADFFDRMFAINTRAPLFCSEAAIRAFRKQNKPGSIVTVGSLNAWCGQSDLTVYSMSKGALMTMTRNLADAVGTQSIRVNQLNVGWTFTETEDATQQREGRAPGWQNRLPTANAPRGELMRPSEVAAHTAFWLSDDSSPVSGQIYEVEQFPIIGRIRMAE